MKKITSLMLITIILFIVVLSTFFITQELGHKFECDNNECPICILIEQCQNTLKQLKDGISNVFHISISILFSVEQLFYSLTFVVCDTLVSQKIRLNN